MLGFAILNIRRGVICSLLALAAGASGGSEFCRAFAQQNPPPAAQSQRDVVGTWEGTLDAGSVKLKLVLHVAGAKDGSFSGTLDVPAQGAKDLPVDSVTVADGAFRFEMKSLAAVYEGKLTKDGSAIEGQFKQAGQTFPLTLKRTGLTATKSLLQLQKVDAGGHSLGMLVGGGGTPAVVFEGGAGTGMISWSSVQGDVAKFARTVSYDRAGVGQSELGPKPRSAKQIALELHAALLKAGINPPYVLVGHSLGGVFVRVFADLYPKDVAGLVLIDPSQEGFDDWASTHKIAQPKDDQAQLNLASQGTRDEIAELKTSYAQARVAKVPSGVPVILMTAMQDDSMPAEARKAWAEKHEEWIAKIPGGKHIIVEKSGHFIQGERPQLVIDAIKEVVNQSQSKKQ